MNNAVKKEVAKFKLIKKQKEAIGNILEEKDQRMILGTIHGDLNSAEMIVSVLYGDIAVKLNRFIRQEIMTSAQLIEE